jgi:hypothetical protein
MRERLRSFLSVGDGDIGTIGGGKRRPTGRIASIHRYGHEPSIGRLRKACTRSSISAHSRETWLLEMPVMPIALTRSSTDRVETPCT